MEVVETRYFYEGLSHLVHKEYSPSGSPYAEYYIGANNRIVSQKMFGYHGRSIPGHDPTMKTTGGMMYYHYDGMSTVSEFTDRHGAEIQSYRYDAFGGLVNGITTPFNTTSYTGHIYEQDAGLIDMRARMYDASTARFLQEDTYAGTLGNPLSQNRYAYVMNDPVNYLDPTGRVPQEVVDRQSFWKTLDFDESQSGLMERWFYSYQGYNYHISTQNLNITIGDREIIERWDELLTEYWYYRADLLMRIDHEGTMHPVDNFGRDETFTRNTVNPRQNVTTAEELVQQNMEFLQNHYKPKGYQQ